MGVDSGLPDFRGPEGFWKAYPALGQRRIAFTSIANPAAFRREPKPDFTPELFAFCIWDYWTQWHPGEATLPYREIALNAHTVGQIIKLPEEDVRARLEAISLPSSAPFRYQPSAVEGTLHKTGELGEHVLLEAVYAPAPTMLHLPLPLVAEEAE